MTAYVDLITIGRHLLAKKWFILGVALTVLAFAMTYVLMKSRQYQGTLLLQIEQRSPESLAARQDNPAGESMNMHIALLRSRFILLPVIQSLGLDIHILQPPALHISQLSIPAHYLGKKLHLKREANQYNLYDNHHRLLTEGTTIKINPPDMPLGSEALIIKDSAIETMHHLLTQLAITDLTHTEENSRQKRGLLKVALIGEDPARIAAVLNEIAHVMTEKNLQRKALETEKKLTFLKRQLPVVAQSLHESEKELNHYRFTTGKADIKLETRYLMTHLSYLDKELDALRLKKAVLLQQYTLRYPLAQAVNDKIQVLQKQRKAVYEALKRMPAEDQTGAAIREDLTARYQLYLSLLNQIHELELSKAGLVSDIEVLVPANPPELPIPRRLWLVAIGSLLMGTGLGCLIVLARKIIRYRIAIDTREGQGIHEWQPN